MTCLHMGRVLPSDLSANYLVPLTRERQGRKRALIPTTRIRVLSISPILSLLIHYQVHLFLPKRQLLYIQNACFPDQLLFRTFSVYDLLWPFNQHVDNILAIYQTYKILKCVQRRRASEGSYSFRTRVVTI